MLSCSTLQILHARQETARFGVLKSERSDNRGHSRHAGSAEWNPEPEMGAGTGHDLRADGSLRTNSVPVPNPSPVPIPRRVSWRLLKGAERNVEGVSGPGDEPVHSRGVLILSFLRLHASRNGFREGTVKLLDVTDDPGYRGKFEEALNGRFVALGLPGFEESDGQLQAYFLFPWLEKDPALSGLFERLCEEAVRQVRQEFQTRRST